MVKLSHPYINSGKTIALTIWTFVDKMMSLLFYMLSRFVIAFFPIYGRKYGNPMKVTPFSVHKTRKKKYSNEYFNLIF